MSTILYRLDSMDKRLERMESNITTLQYPSLALYQSEQMAQNEKIESAVKLAMWSLGLVCTLTISALIAALVRLVAA